MIQISPQALRDGCERACDLFMLNQLRGYDEAGAGFDALCQALGIDSKMRETLGAALRDLVPIRGIPELEAATVISLHAGVLVGLLIADSAFPAEELDLPVIGTP